MMKALEWLKARNPMFKDITIKKCCDTMTDEVVELAEDGDYNGVNNEQLPAGEEQWPPTASVSRKRASEHDEQVAAVQHKRLRETEVESGLILAFFVCSFCVRFCML